MRLLRCIASVNPVYGGPIEGIKQISATLETMGHRVEIASLDAPEDPWVKACPVRTHALGPGRGVYRFSPRLVPWLTGQRESHDAVIAHGLWTYASLGVWRACRRGGVPYFVYPHGMLDPWFKRAHPLKHLKKWLYWPWAEYRVLRDARAVLFTCEEERRLARRSFALYRCRERVVNYGTAAPPGTPEGQRAAFLRQFPELTGKRILLFLGRIHPKKGCDLLIKAFARLRRRDVREPDIGVGAFHLVMAGPDQGGWRAELEGLACALGIRDHVTWTGMVEGDVKWGAVRCAEAFVLPSHQENFGIAVVEALACGVPVLISNQVNIWREIAAAGVGFVDADTEAGVGNLLGRWATLSAPERSALAERAAACFGQRFEARRAAEALVREVADDVGQ